MPLFWRDLDGIEKSITTRLYCVLSVFSPIDPARTTQHLESFTLWVLGNHWNFFLILWDRSLLKAIMWTLRRRKRLWTPVRKPEKSLGFLRWTRMHSPVHASANIWILSQFKLLKKNQPWFEHFKRQCTTWGPHVPSSGQPLQSVSRRSRPWLSNSIAKVWMTSRPGFSTRCKIVFTDDDHRSDAAAKDENQTPTHYLKFDRTEVLEKIGQLACSVYYF